MKILSSFLTNWGKVVATVIPVTGLILSFNYLGWLSTLELTVYDLFFQWKPLETLDERIVIVGLSEPEIDKYYPLTDVTLAQLIKQIKRQNPSVIGLDFYRDITVGSGAEELKEVFESTPNLFGVQKVIGDENSIIKPPPVLKDLGQIASSDVVVDGDGVLRRALMMPNADGETNLYSLGATLGILYLMKQNFNPQDSPDGKSMQIGEVIFRSVSKHDGGYQNGDFGGYQVLLNYRNPKQSFKKVSFSDVISEKVSPNLFKNRIVLIGATAPSIRDVFYTPFSRSLSAPPSMIYGVEVQANIASHLVSSVLDNRPIIKTLPNPIEDLLMVFWGSLTAFLLWRLRSEPNYLKLGGNLVGITGLLAVVLVGGSYLAFLGGWWIPVIPSLLEISVTSLLISGLILTKKNQELTTVLTQLKLAQEQMLREKKQAALATIVAGIAHEVNNPLNYIINFAELSLEQSEKLSKGLSNLSENLTLSSVEKIQPILATLTQNLVDILEQGQKATSIVGSLPGQANPKSQRATLTNINNLVDDNIHLVTYSKQIEKNDFSLNLETSYDPALGEKMIVASDLAQIVINLLNNACDAVFEKKQRTELDFEPTIIVTTQLVPQHKIEISVIDNGDGISSEITSQIFEPFVTTKAPGEGTGLGLYLTYELVQKNQGEIHWTRDNHWTKFIVQLNCS